MARISSEQRLAFVEPLAKYGRRAETALNPLLADLYKLLIQGSNQASLFLIEQLLSIDPKLDARIRRLWPDTIANLYDVAAKRVRKSLKRKSPS